MHSEKVKEGERRLEIKEANIFLSPHDAILRGEGVFGLGESNFNPQTNTVTVIRYSSNPIELLATDNFMLLSLCTTFSHEIGHYCLTMGSRIGIVIKDINVVLDGMCLAIIKRMLKKHGRVWIPFRQYLDFPRKDLRIEKLIKNMLRLDDLENALVDNYQITQELFAYSWSGLISTFSKAMCAGLFGSENRDALLKSMASFGMMQDSERMNEINQKIRQFFFKRGIDPGEVGEEEAKMVLENLDEIFGSDKDIVEGVLRWVESIQGLYVNPEGRPYDHMTRLMDSILAEYRLEVDKEYERSCKQHIEALTIFRDYSTEQRGEMLKIIGSLLGISCLFAPVVDPLFIKKGRSAKIRSMDQSTRGLIRKLGRDEVGFGDLDSIMKWITAFQNETQSVSLRDMSKVPLSSILGTREWFSELLANLDLTRIERRFVRRLLVSNKVVDLNEKPLLACESLASLIPPSFRIVIRLAFLLKDRLKRMKLLRLWTEPLFEGLKKLHIDSGRTLFNLLEVYRDVPFSSPLFALLGEGDKKEGVFLKPSLAVHIDHELLTFYTNKDFSSAAGRLTVYRHILGNLKELCLKGKAPQTVCPISYLQAAEGLCGGEIKECWLRKMLGMAGASGHMLICCREGKANFFRMYSKSESPDPVLRFKIDDRDAQKRREKFDFERDMLNKIWLPQAERLKSLWKEQPKPQVHYDGQISDLYSYRKRKLEIASKRIVPPLLRALWKTFTFLLFPFKLDYRIHKAVLRYRLRKTRMECRKTQRQIRDIMSWIQNL